MLRGLFGAVLILVGIFVVYYLSLLMLYGLIMLGGHIPL